MAPAATKKSVVPRAGGSSFEKALLKRPAAAAHVLKRPEAAAQSLKRLAAAAPAAGVGRARPSKARRTQEPQAKPCQESDALMEAQRAEELEAKGGEEPEVKGGREQEAEGGREQEAEGGQEQEAKCSEEPEVTGSAGSEETELTVFLASGSQLAVLRVGPAWTGADVKAAVSVKLAEGTRLDALVSGSRAFEDQLTVRDFGLSGSAELQAVLGKAEPVLHLVEACSALALASRHFCCWSSKICSGGEGSDAEEAEDGAGDYGFCLRGVQHRALDTAPPAAREVAQELGDALAADVGSAGGDLELIAISHAGSDAREACLRGLAIRREDRRFDKEGNELCRPAPEGEGLDLWGATVAESVDVSTKKANPDFRDLAKFREVMGRRLTGHFRFRFSMHFLSPEPIVLGGFTSDGSIVGVLGGEGPYAARRPIPSSWLGGIEDSA